jgi:hypothetical protein
MTTTQFLGWGDSLPISAGETFPIMGPMQVTQCSKVRVMAFLDPGSTLDVYLTITLAQPREEEGEEKRRSLE